MRHRDYKNVEKKKQLFLNELMKSRGIKSVAYQKAGIGKTKFFEWQQEDIAFSEAIKEIEDRWLDVVESKLMDLVLMNDKTAIIFCLKSKAKHRGYR